MELYDSRIMPSFTPSPAFVVCPDFMRRLADPSGLLALFDTLPGVFFYAKDRDSRFTAVNLAQARRLAALRKGPVLGRTAHDFFDRGLADAYEAEDALVLRGKPILNKRWIGPGPGGRMCWYLSSKLPLYGPSGGVVGLCGLLRDINLADAEVKPCRDLREVMAHIHANFRKPLPVPEMAAMMELSASQFDRRFKAATGQSPTAYIQGIRMAAAREQLEQTDHKLSRIARELGFHDQSHFVRKFRQATGRTPGEHRKNAGAPAARPAF